MPTGLPLPDRIPAVYMRGGTGKGVFFVAPDLPADPVARDRILLRAIGSPDTAHSRGRWVVRKVSLSRSARRLMEGCVCLPRA